MLSACGEETDSPGVRPSLPVADARVMHPILLIHGLGGSPEGWADSGLVEFLESQGLRNGDVIGPDGAGGPGDFFLLRLSEDSKDDLESWSDEIARGVDEMIRATGLNKVALVGYSAGGVAARHYLAETGSRSRVATLVTLASPHDGSPMALVGSVDWAVAVAENLAPEWASNAVALLAAVEAKLGFNLSDAAVGQLVPPRFGGDWIERLRRRPLPADVRYVSIRVSTSGLAHEVASCLIDSCAGLAGTDRWIKLFNDFLTVVGGGGLGWDGLVSIESQSLVATTIDGRRIPVRQVDLPGIDHFRATDQGPAILEALSHEVRFLSVSTEHDGEGEIVQVEFTHPMGSLSSARLRLNTGDPPRGRAVIEVRQRGRRQFVSARFSVPTRSWTSAQVSVYTPDDIYEWLLPIQREDASPMPSRPGRSGHQVRVLVVRTGEPPPAFGPGWDLPEHGDNPPPEQLLRLTIGQGTPLYSHVAEESDGPIRWDWTQVIAADPERDALVVALLDDDPEEAHGYQVMDSLRLEGGVWTRKGPFLSRMVRGTEVEFRFEWSGRVRIISPRPFRLRVP